LTIYTFSVFKVLVIDRRARGKNAYLLEPSLEEREKGASGERK